METRACCRSNLMSDGVRATAKTPHREAAAEDRWQDANNRAGRNEGFLPGGSAVTSAQKEGLARAHCRGKQGNSPVGVGSNKGRPEAGRLQSLTKLET